MSRATDAFSSLISDVPGVDTSCFVKRTLNDLRGGEQGKRQQSPPSEEKIEVQKREPVLPTSDVTFASMDLDTLGKQTVPNTGAQNAAPLEDLFGNIPGCEEPVLHTGQDWKTQDKHQNLTVESSPAPKEMSHPEVRFPTRLEDLDRTSSPDMAFPIKDRYSDYKEDPEVTFVQPDTVGQTIHPDVPFSTKAAASDFAEPPKDAFYQQINEDKLSEELDLTEELEDEETASPPPFVVPEDPSESASKQTDLKHQFDKYRKKLNKKAVELKKKGLKAMRQGLDAAQEWMDKKVEDRKQSTLTSQQKKEETKQIELFLADMEKLSHYRRELLMSEVPAEFFQKVLDYAEAKNISVEHLFVTSTEETTTLQESPTAEQVSPELHPNSLSEESEASTKENENNEWLEVTGEDSEESPEAEVEPEFDLLGLSSQAKGASKPTNSFFTGGGAVAEQQQQSTTPPVPFAEDVDLMEFEGGCTSNIKSDFTKMYQRLKAGGQHTEEEIRAILKTKRQEEKQSKMAAALQAKVDREREVEENQELLCSLKEKHRQSIVNWKEKHADNMRGLLTTLQTVLWEDSGWKALTVAQVLEVSQVKKAYMKANLIIHPDKVKQKGGTAEQVVLADMVFNVLKEAWQKFQS